jgi:hypothetical protein
MALEIERIYAALPDAPMADEHELDDVLRRVFKIRDGDEAKLGIYRETVNYWKLVLRGPDGLIRKVAALPKPKSESERIAEIAAEQRQERETMWARQDHSNPMRAELERAVAEIVGARIEALEEQVTDLQQQLEALQSQDTAVEAAVHS